MEEGTEGAMAKIRKRLFLLANCILAVVFLPVLACVTVAGNRMNYHEDLKLATLLPNWFLFLVACAGLGVICFLFWWEKERSLSLKEEMLADTVLAILFAGLFFLNVRVVKEIAFMVPWDVMVVSVSAREIAQGHKLGYFYYLSLYSNNIPITYILTKLYRKAMEIADYPYVRDFIWMQVNCAWISIGGYFSCLTVKKLTGRLMPVAVTFLLYLALAGMSPWKMVPYTDTYGMIFPIISIYFYICFRSGGKRGLKYVYLFLSLAAGMLGGFVKPSIYIIVIAILGVEAVRFFTGGLKEWRYVCFEILLVIVMMLGLRAYRGYIIEEIGLEFNEEIEADWKCYFRMGLNEENTGSYYSEDTVIFGQYDTDKAERQRVCMEEAAERLRERGILGTIWFWIRKMTMTFNDGSFGWECEVWIHDYYPDLAGNDSFTLLLRDIFWPNSRYTGRYNTFCQLAWIFCLLGFPGICLCRREELEKNIILSVSFLGLFFYQMLFEARARYLFSFLPLLIAISICGMRQYFICLKNCMGRRRGEGTLRFGGIRGGRK